MIRMVSMEYLFFMILLFEGKGGHSLPFRSAFWLQGPYYQEVQHGSRGKSALGTCDDNKSEEPAHVVGKSSAGAGEFLVPCHIPEISRI